MALSIETKCIHLENKDNCKNHYGAVSFPIYQTATYAHPGTGKSTGFDYSRLQNPTREQLEKTVASLENGIENLITKNTKALYVETPTNPMMNVSDISLLSKIAKKHGLLLIVDNTFLSPYFQNPLNLGANIVIHSGTKYLGGHNDTLAGFIVTNRTDIQEKLRFLIKTTGAGLAPFDCWLILRGIKTLAVRMERAQENAFKIAKWLKENPLVDRVIYPGFSEHSGHKIMRKQARGFGAMITFQVKSQKLALSILEKVSLIRYAESLGGVETLITYPTTQTHADVPEELRIKNGITNATLRLSVGIENCEDLLKEFKRVFSQAQKEE